MPVGFFDDIAMCLLGIGRSGSTEMTKLLSLAKTGEACIPEQVPYQFGCVPNNALNTLGGLQ
jgi:hypothetical protein